MKVCTSRPWPLGWNPTRAMAGKLSGVGMREAGRPWRHTGAGLGPLDSNRLNVEPSCFGLKDMRDQAARAKLPLGEGSSH